ncbi:MAG: FAD:protein FMN transferase [Candidatus Saccharibacteria bacterium]
MYYYTKRSNDLRLGEASQTKFALGGDVTFGLVSSLSAAGLNDLFNRLWRQVYAFERQFSRFLPASELTAFNHSDGLRIPISPEFKDLLLAAQDMSFRTRGLYNPFILPALQHAGYLKSAVTGYGDDPQDDYSGRQVVTAEKLQIGDDWASIPHGTAIDIGGCGKGYLADRLAISLKEEPVTGYWLSLGGDVATMGSDKDGANLIINIQNAQKLDEVSDWLVKCPKKVSAIATSGTFKRKNQVGKADWHHIIDPISLKPALTDVLLATVCADTAIKADVLASCAVILGSKQAPAFLKQHGAQSALLQCSNEDGESFEVQFGNRIVELQHV